MHVVVGFEADIAAAKAAELALPDLDSKVTSHNLSHFVEGSGTEKSVSLNFSKYATGWETNLRSLLDDLGFNASATIARMGNTRALDGTLTAKAPHVDASWTYHRDAGLSVVLERDR